MKLISETINLAAPAEYQIPEMPDGSVIDRWRGPWHNDARPLGVNVGRTQALREWDVPITLSGSSYWEGVISGMPYNIVPESAKKAKVLNLGGETKISWAGISWPTVTFPDPGVMLRTGDPMGGFDNTAKLVVVDAKGDPKELYEFIQLNTPFPNVGNIFMAALAGASHVAGWNTAGYKGTGVYRYDLRKAWTTHMGGVTGGGGPNLPMLLRWDEIERGRIDHCLFGVPANYAPERTGWAKSTDGTWPGHPLRAGEILRLTEKALSDVADRFGSGSTPHIVATAMNEFGIWIGDKYTTGAPSPSPVKINVSMDSRWNLGSSARGPIEDMGLMLTDFEVVAQ